MSGTASTERLDQLKAAAQAYRLALPSRPDLDTRKSLILYYREYETGRFVKLVVPVNGDRHQDLKIDWDKAGRAAWREKYGQDMPKFLSMNWAEALSACIEPYEGTKTLSEASKQAIRSVCASAEFTLDMLWLIVEGCNWTPGVPVSEDDAGWIAIWSQAMEDDFDSYVAIVREVMGMPALPPGEANGSWIPSALERYAAAPPGTEPLRH